MNGLACTICGRSSVAKVRLEISLGAATYLVCTHQMCIDTVIERARENLHRAAQRAGVASRVDEQLPFPDAIDVAARDWLTVDDIRAIEGNA